MEASVASPHDDDADESMPNPILDIESVASAALCRGRAEGAGFAAG